MAHTLGTAAKATGKSRTTILRAIRSGKISAEKNMNGQWSIDPSELHRVYPEVLHENVSHADHEPTGNTSEQHRVELLEAELTAARTTIADLRDRVGDLREDRDAWRSAAMQKRLTWRGLFGGGKAE